jgi:hypothetical protein
MQRNRELVRRRFRARGTDGSSLYEMPTSDIAVGVSIIGGMPGCVRYSPKSGDIQLAFPELWLCVCERLCRTSTRDDDLDLDHELTS